MTYLEEWTLHHDMIRFPCLWGNLHGRQFRVGVGGKKLVLSATAKLGEAKKAKMAETAFRGRPEERKPATVG